MRRIVLVNQLRIPHFRVPVYNRLSAYLREHGFELEVVSEGVQSGNPHPVAFTHIVARLRLRTLTSIVIAHRIEAVISWVDLKHLYLFSLYLVVKVFLRRKMVYWGQGCDLLDRESRLKKLAYGVEQAICDAIILYAEHLRKYVRPRWHRKVFVANNTLCLPARMPSRGEGMRLLGEYGIRTRKNVICVGRIQRRKRLDHLVAAFRLMSRPDVGLVLVGPDPDGILRDVSDDNVHKLGAVYGETQLCLLAGADVYCLPGPLGLGVVDALACGLPVVTEDGDESAERMYVRHGVNGFIVPRGDISAMAERLTMLLDDAPLWYRFSEAARREIAENGQIDGLCAGFRDALRYVFRPRTGM